MAGRRRAVGMVAAAALVALAACGGGDDDGAAPEPEPGPEVVVALGDSFTAGEGAPPYEPEPESCRRSADTWPRLLERYLDVASVDLVACGGARTAQLTGPWEDRDLPPQIAARPQDEVTLVVLTIGGNDIGFSDIVATCVLGDCSPAPGTDDLEERLDALRTTLVEEVHPALARAYPNARIVHVGYPRLSPPPEVAPRDCPWLSTADQRTSRGIVDALNAAIEEAAEESGAVDYVDVGDALAGHELCTEDAWVNPISLEPDRAHPTLEGQRALAAAVAKALEPADEDEG